MSATNMQECFVVECFIVPNSFSNLSKINRHVLINKINNNKII